MTAQAISMLRTKVGCGACVAVRALLDACAGMRIVTTQTRCMTCLRGCSRRFVLRGMTTRTIRWFGISPVGKSTVATLAPTMSRMVGQPFDTGGVAALARVEIEARGWRRSLRGEGMGRVTLHAAHA